MKNEPLLYRFGFACVVASELPSGDLWKALRSWWNPIQIRDLLVLAHPEVPVTLISDSALLIGHAFAVGGKRSAQDLLETAIAAGSDSVLHETLDILSGRFTLITSQGGGRVYHDAFGSRTVFYRLGKPPCIASHDGLIAGLFGAAGDPLAEALRREPEYVSRGVTYLPGDLSVHDGIRALAPNNFYDISAGRPVRYWPRVLRQNTTLDQFYSYADTYFSSFAASLLSNHITPVLGVTPGVDSRAIVAAFRHNSLPAKYVTWSDYALPEQDMPIVERIVSYLGGQHTFLRAKAQADDETFRSISELAGRNVGHFRGRSRLTAHMHRVFGGKRDLVFIRGYGGEIIRGFYNITKRPIEALSVAELVRAYNSGLKVKHPSERYIKLVSEAVEQFMLRANYEGLAEFGYDLNDLYYWESRMGMWGSSMHNEMDAAMLSMTGFNSRRLFESAFGLKRSERLTKGILLDMTRRYDEGLAMIPVAPVNEKFDLSKARRNADANTNAFASKQTNASQLHDKLEGIESQLSQLAKHLEAEHKRNRNLNRQYQKEAREQLREALEAERKENEHLKERLEEKRAQLKELKAKYRETVRERDRLKRLYAEIKQSRSWRYTLPVRGIVGVFKRVRA
jgi:hypothetical protein